MDIKAVFNNLVPYQTIKPLSKDKLSKTIDEMLSSKPEATGLILRLNLK